MKQLGAVFSKGQRAAALSLVVFLVCVLGLSGAAYGAYRHFERHLAAQVDQQLALIGDAKLDQLRQWRQERLGAGEFLHKNHAVYSLVGRYLAEPADPEVRRQVVDGLENIQRYHHFEQVRLVSPQGAPLLTLPAGRGAMSETIARKIPEVVASGQVVLQDFYRNANDPRLHLAVLVPILDEPEPRQPLGVLALRIDPTDFLLPNLTHWPILSRTGEAVLLRRDGAEAVVLNELRFQTHAALNLRCPMSQTNQAIVQALLREGPVRGLGYRGQPVVAYARAVPDAPWCLLVSIDRSEIEGALAAYFWPLVRQVGAGSAIMAALLALLWRQRRIRALKHHLAEAEALRMREERYGALVTATSDVLYRMSPDWAEMHQLQGRHFLTDTPTPSRTWLQDYIHPDDQAHVLEAIAEAIRTKSIFELEHRVLCADGSWGWAFSRAVPVLDRNQAIVEWFGAARDITARKQAEAERDQLTQQRQLALDAAQLGWWHYDPASKIATWDERYREIFGVTGHQQPNEEILARLHPDDLPQVWAAVEAALKPADPKPYATQYRVNLPDGSVRWVAAYGKAVFAGAGAQRHAVSFVGTVEDITARKQAELAQARLALAVEQSAESVMITDPSGALVYVNPTFEKITGYTAAEVLGQNPRILKSGKYDAEFYRQMWAKLTTGRPWQGHLINKRKNGSLYEEEASITPLHNAAGQIVNYVAVKRDVTAAVALETQRRQYEKMDALGRMAGAIAHHFNNKLQAVIGNLELVRQDMNPDEPAARCLGDAMRAAGEAAKISGLMLTYLGQAPSECKPLDLAELCRRTMPILRASIPMVLQTDFAAPGPVINANANQVQQLLTNLVTNAWEASRSNQGTVAIALKVVPAGAIGGAQRFPADWHPRAPSYACLAVQDSGCGIAVNNVAKLFDPFYSTKFTGRGLGLAVVLGIVKSHGGVITVESTVGQGSCFRVYFPVIAMAATRLPEPAGVLPEFAASGLVLVVEDDEALLNLAGHNLRSLGFTVLQAQDGVVALDLFRQHQPDIRCVISDVVMPRMDGWQTLEALRRLAPNLPVILASGYDEATVMGGNHPERPQAFLSKPYTRDRLRAALGRALGTPR